MWAGYCVLDAWYIVKIFALPLSHHRSQKIKIPRWWPELEGSRLLDIPTPPVFAYQSGYISKHHPRQDSDWRTVTSEIVVCSFISHFRCSALVPMRLFLVIVCILTVMKGVRVSVSSRLRGIIEQYNVFELLHDSR